MSTETEGKHDTRTEQETDEPSYDVQIHRRADQELESVPEPTQTRIRDAIVTASRHEEPSTAPKTKILFEENLYRVRVGDWRVLMKLKNPYLLVLQVVQREGAYDPDSIGVARSRLDDFGP